MSRIDDMIREMCPDGVEYRTLGEIVEYAREKVLASELDAQNFVGVDNLLRGCGWAYRCKLWTQCGFSVEVSSG